ncbi:GNAT family N-acetyltransferase [Larsenimonas suaedae]|uniref:GNAT family N-acetyltransferase n=1 Tax=Larsenimonas suaedae TaxID=1851019 RepID=A0ABU1GY27_9GAMM|nr:GNAT family N-acetyltransferase [Larsenimonas suaedae]MCM2972831.1 GNAT family N-acetyltransferase [Larsenimonas suaedae]MDR5896930.1 GNAT family N-acetyltransferase [Larsenimonas suaedae]
MTPDTVTIDHGDWATLGHWCRPIRTAVFVDEQKIPPAEEWDDDDHTAVHFVLFDQGEALGTARLLPDGHIGRVALLKNSRGRGLGHRLMHDVMDHGMRLHSRLVLSAQTHALGFYEHLGFVATGDEFLEAGIAHRTMVYAVEVND